MQPWLLPTSLPHVLPWLLSAPLPCLSPASLLPLLLPPSLLLLPHLGLLPHRVLLQHLPAPSSLLLLSAFLGGLQLLPSSSPLPSLPPPAPFLRPFLRGLSEARDPAEHQVSHPELLGEGCFSPPCLKATGPVGWAQFSDQTAQATVSDQRFREIISQLTKWPPQIPACFATFAENAKGKQTEEDCVWG